MSRKSASLACFKWSPLPVVWWLAMVLPSSGYCANSSGTQALTNAALVLALPADVALRAIPVRVRGIVTVAEKYWDGRFFVQDESGGVFVDNVSTSQPQPGDLVEVRGITHAGAFAPVISAPSWEKLGTGH